MLISAFEFRLGNKSIKTTGMAKLAVFFFSNYVPTAGACMLDANVTVALMRAIVIVANHFLATGQFCGSSSSSNLICDASIENMPPGIEWSLLRGFLRSLGGASFGLWGAMSSRIVFGGMELMRTERRYEFIIHFASSSMPGYL
jgi:hypothetical protein